VALRFLEKTFGHMKKAETSLSGGTSGESWLINLINFFEMIRLLVGEGRVVININFSKTYNSVLQCSYMQASVGHLWMGNCLAG